MEKIQKMSEKKKKVFALTSAVIITLIVVIFALVLNNLLSGGEDAGVKKPIFDSSLVKELKDSFTNIFNSSTTISTTTNQ